MVANGVDFVLLGSTKDIWCLKEETEQVVCEDKTFPGSQKKRKKLFSNAIRQFGLCTFWQNNEAPRHRMGRPLSILLLSKAKEMGKFAVHARGSE